MMLTFEEAARATGAEVVAGERAPGGVTVSTDTRTLQHGQTYLALRGERFDGHRYLEQAVEKGAAAIVVDSRPERALAVATLIVKDTKAAYMALAAAARDKFGGRVIAITGSTGKTTTKVLLAQLLATHFGAHVAASPANENNEIGVSKLLLGADPQTKALVVEMGARHYGDIEVLVNVARPDTGILTNVGEAHLEIMGSRERLAATKWALFSQGASAVLNARDTVSKTRAPGLGTAPRWFGTGDARVPFTQDGARAVFLPDRTTMILIEDGRERRITIDARIPGDYNLENLAAALAGAIELGCDPGALADVIPALRLPEGRYESVTLPNNVRVVFDAYNASASGTIATLDAFKHEPGARRIAVLSSMAELGSEAPQMHETVGAHAAACELEALLVGGEFARELAEGARRGGMDPQRIVPFEENAQAVEWLKHNARANDVVLLKGSRKYKLEEVLEGMRA